MGQEPRKSVLSQESLRHARRRMIEIRAGQRVEHEHEPHPEEQRHEGDPLSLSLGERKKEQKGIPEADLGERVLEIDHELARPDAAHADADRHEHGGPPQRVPEELRLALALRDPARDREGHDQADEECKGGLNDVVQRRSGPRDVALGAAKKIPRAARGARFAERRRDLARVERLRQHEEHHEAAVSVDGCDALRPLAFGRGGGSLGCG
jgi:hypothetical protein